MRSKFKWIFALCLALSMQFAFAQEKTVTGVVSDETGPLPGANVILKSTKKGTQTDVDGKYSIKAKAGDVLPEEPIREKVNLTLFFDFKDNHERTLVNYEKAVTETLVKYRILASNNNRIVISNTQKMAKLTGDHYIRILIEKAVVNG